ncbi:hypothetical protein HALO59_150020 [Halomonas sp. 59]|nr:hypothetical protein HALO59_150020 [Halomonas sp. 59]CAD5256912.1 hypothetical protein HALO113_160022 [Halomonas sp. 113]CAD5270711.1 hypothetical protein HALOI3_200022 [Halomonas sp. I3]VXB21825.1 hypothetical protein HALO98_160020 [Halomonas titanicae]VXC27022.1 hypothetical protein HALO153_320020 [Halomonas titanicae]
MATHRIDHEVIISHLEAEPGQPLISGRTYHASNTPSYPLAPKKLTLASDLPV